MSPSDKITLIGNRISTLKAHGVSSFVIIPTATNWKLHLLFIWLLLWTVSGIIVAGNYFTLTNTNTKIMIVVWLGFWAYFEFRIGRSFIFKKFGKEKIWIKQGKLTYWRDIAGRGKQIAFDKDLIKDLQLIEKNKRDFFQFMNESFWVMGGESISFGYGAKTYRLGVQLNEEDAKELLKQLRQCLV
ncbi:MAG: hypothetical protein ACYDCN_00260 [Bacteroidia bacterium]